MLYAKLEHIERLLTKEEHEIVGEERDIAEERHDEETIANGVKQEASEMERLERLEQDIKKDVAHHPLAKITYHDFTKGLIGAFFGVVGHFAFFEGSHIAESLSILRATAIIFASLLLLVIFLYFSGFRRVKEYHSYLALRVAVIYFTALFVAIGVLFLFGIITLPTTFETLYTNVAAVSILAVMGAATADLIGGEA